MSDGSKIEWTEASWNPVTGCTKVSPGCDHCYAETFAERWRGIPGHHFEQGFDVVLRPERLDQPLRWRRPRRVFVNSMSDLFHDAIPDEYIARVFGVMARAPQHTFQLLTKRHARMRSLLRGVDGSGHRLLEASTDEETAAVLYERWPLPNVWLGVSVENQQWADIRIPALLETPAAVRWISAEPLLGSLNLSPWLTYGCPRCGRMAPWTDGRSVRAGDETDEYWCQTCGIEVPLSACTPPGLSWVVAGGESGPGARPAYPDWFRSLRDQCQRAGVPYFLKQLGQFAPVHDEPRAGDLWVKPDGTSRPCSSGPGNVRYRTGYIRHSNGDIHSIDCCHTDAVAMRRHGRKHDAGRLLDERTWDEYPTSDPVVSR